MPQNYTLKNGSNDSFYAIYIFNYNKTIFSFDHIWSFSISACISKQLCSPPTLRAGICDSPLALLSAHWTSQPPHL